MKEKTIYIAFDGEEFESKEECQDYEDGYSFSDFHENITVLDENGEEIVEWWKKNPDNFYGLYFTTAEAQQAFSEFFGAAILPWYNNYYMVSIDEKVNYVNTHWVYLDDDEWHCLEKDLEIAQSRYKEWMKNF